MNARHRKLLGLAVLAFILMVFFILIFGIGACTLVIVKGNVGSLQDVGSHGAGAQVSRPPQFQREH